MSHSEALGVRASIRRFEGDTIQPVQSLTMHKYHLIVQQLHTIEYIVDL